MVGFSAAYLKQELQLMEGLLDSDGVRKHLRMPSAHVFSTKGATFYKAFPLEDDFSFLQQPVPTKRPSIFIEPLVPRLEISEELESHTGHIIVSSPYNHHQT